MLYLARHGRTPYNLERRFQGQGPVPLDELGRRQAAELAELAVPYGFRALWCSSLLRARETARAVAARVGLEPRIDARFDETATGEWTDRLFDDVAREAPEAFAAWASGDPDFAFPGGESFREQAARVAAGLADVREGPLPALVVCHGVTIRLALGAAGGDGRLLADPVGNGALVPLPG